MNEKTLSIRFFRNDVADKSERRPLKLEMHELMLWISFFNVSFHETNLSQLSEKS